MKFGQDFQVALARDEYPQQWIDSAISYKKLKKCIKRVQQELESLGLDKEILNELWQHVSSSSDESEAVSEDKRLHYTLDGSGKVKFTPRLTIAIDPSDGSPIDAWLSTDTRRVLRRLAKSSKAINDSSSPRSTSVGGNSDSLGSPERDQSGSDDDHTTGDNLNGRSQHLETIEVPLTSDSEFFQILRRELADLDHLQQSEQERLEQEIIKLGHELRDLKAGKSKRSKQETEAWRQIFEIYSDAEVFLSSHEADAGSRDYTHAQEHFQTFNKTLKTQQNGILKLSKPATESLGRFLSINVTLLRLMKFQDINRIALAKIMKKFDKRTALHAQSSIQSSLLTAPFLAQNLARATCFTISKEILDVIPQLNDYLCPICFTVAWKPVRLRCNHIFCIRCMIVLQRQEKAHCPLCREAVVMEATAGKPIYIIPN
jgi:E3 ubiquitin-protein ligase BAH